MASKHPLKNVVYYDVGRRVLWQGQPGMVCGLVKKDYDLEVGYNILLDSQSDKSAPEVTNAGYDELVRESTGKPSTTEDKICI